MTVRQQLSQRPVAPDPEVIAEFLNRELVPMVRLLRNDYESRIAALELLAVTQEARIAALEALYDFGPQIITGTSYTLALTDNWKLLQVVDSGAVTITVPLAASAPFVVGETQIYIELNGTGSIAFAGATVESVLVFPVTSQFQVLTLSYTAADRWLVS